MHLRFARTQGDHGCLADVEVVDIEIEMRLLRLIVARPNRRLMIGSQLERKRCPNVAAQLHPVAMVTVEEMPPLLCRAAGEALGAVRQSFLADAIVMASAALRGGGIVYTSDVDDLCRLQRHFPTVLVLPV